MTREDNPEYFGDICEVVKAVFLASQKIKSERWLEKIKAGEKTTEEYIEALAEELIRPIDPSQVEDFYD